MLDINKGKGYDGPYIMGDKMSMLIKEVSKGKTYRGRVVVVVELQDGRKQPFYKSTGHCSAHPGTWFPFNGVTFPSGLEWFDKKGFYEDTPRTDPLHRFGIQLWKDVSDEMAELEMLEAMSEGEARSGKEVNEFLVSHGVKIPEKSS